MPNNFVANSTIGIAFAPNRRRTTHWLLKGGEGEKIKLFSETSWTIYDTTKVNK